MKRCNQLFFSLFEGLNGLFEIWCPFHSLIYQYYIMALLSLIFLFFFCLFAKCSFLDIMHVFKVVFLAMVTCLLSLYQDHATFMSFRINEWVHADQYIDSIFSCTWCLIKSNKHRKSGSTFFKLSMQMANDFYPEAPNQMCSSIHLRYLAIACWHAEYNLSHWRIFWLL